VDVTVAAGKEECGLACRVGAADDDHAGTLTRLGLHLGRGVEDTRTLKVCKPVDCQATVACAGRDDDGPATKVLAAIELDNVAAAVEGEATGRDRDGAVRTEALSLERSTLSEIRARDPSREAEVVLDLADLLA
jgi:hypothetical protein